MVTQIHRFMQDATDLPVMLVVGNHAEWHRMGRKPVVADGIHWTDYTLLNADLLGKCGADVVLCPLISSDFDVLDIAARLHELSYTGRLRAMAAKLPNPAMIRKEVGFAAPSIDFDLYMIGDESVNANRKPRSC